MFAGKSIKLRKQKIPLMKKPLHSSRSLLSASPLTSSLLLLLAVSALFLPSTGHAQESWTFDPSFQRTPLFITSESASGVHVLQSGKVLIDTINGGLLSGANGERIGRLIRVDGTTGAIDSTRHPIQL